MRQRLRVIQRSFELAVYYRIWAQLRTRTKRVVVLKELRLEHSQPVELGEKIPCSLADWPDWIIGVLSFPGRKIFLRPGKIQVVKSHEPAVELCSRDGIGRVTSHRHNTRCQGEPKGCYHTED